MCEYYIFFFFIIDIFLWGHEPRTWPVWVWSTAVHRRSNFRSDPSCWLRGHTMRQPLMGASWCSVWWLQLWATITILNTENFKHICGNVHFGGVIMPVHICLHYYSQVSVIQKEKYAIAFFFFFSILTEVFFLVGTNRWTTGNEHLEADTAQVVATWTWQ